MKYFKRMKFTQEILILVVLVLVHNSAVNGKSIIFEDQQDINLEKNSCLLSNGLEGICQDGRDCEGPEKELIDQKKFWDLERCGFDGFKPLFCCTKPLEINTEFEKLLCKNRPKVIRTSQNIIGGKLANPGEFPHQVALGYQQNPQSPLDFKCGGCLISNRLILTAAHCVNRDTPTIVRLGRVSLVPDEYDYGPVVDMRVQKNLIKIHPQYSRMTRRNDIALIYLSKAVQFSDYIQPICLSSPIDLTHKNMTVTGFGKVNTKNNKRSDWLQKAIVVGAPFNECRDNIINADSSKDIDDTQFCALGKNDEDSCNGDSGGPIIYEQDNQQRLYGIVSFSIGCGGIPAVYTKIDKFHEWIKDQIELISNQIF